MEEARSPNLMGASEKTSKRAEWDDSKKDHFVNLLVIYRKKNGQSKEMWSKEIWATITAEMKAKFQGSDFSTKQLKQLERDLKKKYRSMKDIMLKYDLPFDKDKCIIEASANVWERIFQDDPKAKRWQKRLPYYAKLDTLYQDGNASSKKHQVPGCNSYHSIQPHSTSVATRTNGEMNQTLNSPTFNHAQPIHTEEQYNSVAEFDPKSFHHFLVPTSPLFDCNEQSQIHDNSKINSFDAYDGNEPFNQVHDQAPPLANSTQLSYLQMPASITFGGNEPSQIQHGMDAYSFGQFNQSQHQHVLVTTNPDAEFARRLNLNGVTSSYCPSITDCIKVYNNLSEFDENDVLHVTEIFKDRQNRELFSGFSNYNRAIWLRQQIFTRMQQQ